MGLANIGLAAMDATGVGAIIKGATVGAFKWGSRALLKEVYKGNGKRLLSMEWGNVRKRLLRRGLVDKGVATHHWLFQQNGRMNWVPDWLKNHPINLMPNISDRAHGAVHHGNILEAGWFGTPAWFKSAAAGAGSFVGGLFTGSNCECD